MLLEAEDRRNQTLSSLESKVRELQLECKTSRRSLEEERERFMSTLNEALASKAAVEAQLQQILAKKKGTSLLEMESDEDSSVIRSLDAQVANLGQQLLRKEGALLELQAEKASLKSKLQDLTIR